MTTITHHPDDSTLLSYAAGSLPAIFAAVVAGHVEMCPACAAEVRRMEQIGILLLADLAPASLDRPVPQLALRALEAEIGEPPRRDESAGDVPRVLTGLIGVRLADIQWKRLGANVWHLPLRLSKQTQGDLRLLRVGPGQAMPEHGHGGTELTLILQGAYRDEFGSYRIGDLADLDGDAEHRPIADERDGCICLIASERRAQFKGVLGRLMQPFTGV